MLRHLVASGNRTTWLSEQNYTVGFKHHKYLGWHNKNTWLHLGKHSDPGPNVIQVIIYHSLLLERKVTHPKHLIHAPQPSHCASNWIVALWVIKCFNVFFHLQNQIWKCFSFVYKVVLPYKNVWVSLAECLMCADRRQNRCTFEYSNAIYGALKANSIHLWFVYVKSYIVSIQYQYLIWCRQLVFWGYLLICTLIKTNGIIKIKQNTQTE